MVRKKNPFRRAEMVEVEGFQVKSYKSLLAREQQLLMEKRRDIYSNIKAMVAIQQEMANELGVTTKDIAVILKNEGRNPVTGENHLGQLEPYLLRITEMQDETQLQHKYLNAAVATILASRLDFEYLATLSDDLKEAFDIEISQEDLTYLAEVDYRERLDNDKVKEITDYLASNLPVAVFNAFVDFVILEENNGVNPEKSTSEDLNPKA